MFRGPNALGVGIGGTPPVEFGPERNVLWKVALPEGHSSPVVWGDRIFVTAAHRAERRLEVIALERGSGQVVWRRSVKAENLESVHSINNPAASSAATDGERVYAYFGSHGVVAYRWNGEPAWEVKLPHPRATFGTGGSPVLAGELLLINRANNPNPELLALHKKDGRLVWKAEMGPTNAPGVNTSHATPVIWNEEVILHRPNEIRGIALKDGTALWWVVIGSQGTSTPIVEDGVLYVNAFSTSPDSLELTQMPPFAELLKIYDSNGDGKIQANEFPPDFIVMRRRNLPLEVEGHFRARSMFGFIDTNKDGGADQAEIEAIAGWIKLMANPRHGITAIRPGGEGDRTLEAVLWREGRNVPEAPSPLVVQGRLYAVMNGGIVSCLDAETGKVIYRGRIGALGPYYSSPVAAGNKIYAASADGVVTVLSAGDKLEVLARNDLGEGVFATPAPVGGVLYIRSSGHLWAFGEPRQQARSAGPGAELPE